MIDPGPMWDFNDPAASERRFRTAADTAEDVDRQVLLTQVARALGLQERYDDGHAVLDELATNVAHVATRVALERGRLLRSAGEPDRAVPHFEAAERSAETAGLPALQIDALHMRALVAPSDAQVGLTEQALALARAATDPAARNWDAALLNNLGMTHADAGDFEAALPVFEQALDAHLRIGDPERIRVARWMVGWALRNLHRRQDALAVQQALKDELDAAGLDDPYVDEELALLTDPS